MAVNKETDIQVQEAKRVPNKINPRDPHQDIQFKWQKLKREFERQQETPKVAEGKKS